jgi:hypothetical protein
MPNIFIAVILAIFIYKNRNWPAIFIGLFLYSSLHYSFFLDHAELPLLSKLIGGVFVLSAYIYLFTLPDTKAMLNMLRSNVILRNHLLLLGVFVITSLIYWVIDVTNGRFPSLLGIKTIVFSSITWLFACLSASAILLCQITLTDEFKKQIVDGMLVLLVASTAVAVTEVWYGSSYAHEMGPNGFVIARANSFLYNPNVFGLWLSLCTTIVALLYNLRLCSRNKLMVLMFMLVLSLVLTGSRGAFLTCLIMLFVIFITHRYQKGRFFSNDLLPIYFWSGYLVLVSVVAILLNYFNIHNHFNDSLLKSVERFYNMPMEVAAYAILEVVSKIGYEIPGFHVSSDTIQSISGRISVTYSRHGGGLEDKDSIYIALMESNGTIRLLAWVILWAYAIRLGFITLIKKPGTFSSYSLAAIIGCAFAGFTMRTTQLFPVWVLISISLSLSLAWLASVHQENMDHNQHKSMPAGSGVAAI